MQLEICSIKGTKICEVQVENGWTVNDIKKAVAKSSHKLNVYRQSIRDTQKGKSIEDSVTVSSLNLKHGSKLYVKDMGPQISWTTVFLTEYAGPLIIYNLFALRPSIIYGPSNDLSSCATMAAVCWSIHYFKRLLETLFVHRFSHGTMPLRNLFKNCSYYWGFAAYVAYHINHPLFTPPHFLIQFIGLVIFVVSELGNLSIHILLRNLRPPGTKVRKIPTPNGNPLTLLFKYVSCPNYLYEFYSWCGFTLMTSCLPAGLFAVAGMIQMTIWALDKHRKYKKEFTDYPRGRKAIIPFIL